MNTILKRVISLMLCFVLAASYLPVSAFATENGEMTATEVTEPSTEATEPSTEATEPSTEATEPSTEATEPSTEATEPSTEATEPPTETTGPSADAPVADGPAAMDPSADMPMADGPAAMGPSADDGIMLLDEEIEALAADNGIVEVIAASDFQQNAGHATSDSVMESILTAAKEAGYTDIDGAIFCGDYSNQMTAADSNEGLSYVYGNYNEYWGLDYDNIVFVQGNHDPAATSYLAPSGENDPESGGYGVFVINEDDYGWASGDYGKSESEIKATAANLKTYLDAKLEAKFDAPIFIASHLPLHYSMRTYNDGDCRYAQYIFDVLNEASEAGLNIIYLYGHNHSQSFENYHGGGAVFYSAGDEILIGDTSNQKTHHTETIQFTYLNAGFTGRFDAEDTADPTNTATVFEIHNDKVVITRFDANGTHNLKSAGVQSKKYSTEASLYGVNDRVEGSPQTITLKQFEPDPTVEHEGTGITVTAPGVTNVTVTVQTPTYDTNKYSAYASYDITLDGYTRGDTATVTIPAPESFVTSKPAVVLYEGAVIATDDNITDGITFTTDHFSEYDIAQVDESAGETASGNLVSTTTVGDNAVSAVESGSYYLIQHAHDTSHRTLTNTTANNGKALSISGTVNASNTNLWYITSANGGYYIQFGGPNGQYLTIGNDTAGLTNTATVITIGDQESNEWSFEVSGYWLNQIGGRNNNNNYAAGWTGKGTDAGDHWNLYKVETGDGSPVSLTVTPASKTIITGTTATLTASVLVNNADATSKTITWSSSDSTIATVNANGVVTGVADGTATITATLTYANNQKVNGTVKVEIPVTVVTKEIKSVTVDPMTGYVERGSKNSAPTHSTITVTYEDDTTENDIPVTVGMLGGTYDLSKNGTYTGLTVTYAGRTVSGYSLTVTNVSGNNYPEYPNEGAVKVNKTGTGIDFQASGIAQVEISASGVPSKKGSDVIIMLDTSSSMNTNLSGQSTTRLEALRSSLKTLIAQLQSKSEDGSDPDIRVAVTDFNGYVMGNDGTVNSPYYRDTNDKVGDDTTGDADVNAHIFTNVNGTPNNPTVASAATLNETAFQDINTIDLVNNDPFSASRLQLRSGTNYDYAFDAIYQLGEAILAQNAENGEERDLFVIFMSDGGPFQYNYFSGNSSNYSAANGNWNDWLKGTYASWENVPGSSTHKYYYNGPGNTHRMADAIKGDPSIMYDVIRKDATEYVDVTGDGNADDYMTQVPGLGATMYSIGFCIIDDNQLSKDTIESVLKSISSDPSKYYYSVDNGDSLDQAFAAIGNDIAYAANNARFVDQMGANYNLQMSTSTYPVVENGETVSKTLAPKIEIISYDIYTRQDYLDGKVTADKIGDRKGTYTVLETVTFNATGTEAYSSLNSVGPNGNTITAGSNILLDGVIYANTFWYNTNTTNVTINGVDIPTGKDSADLTTGSTNVLPSETFYWKMGTVQTAELAMRYYVYLDGSMEGTREGGSYPTNEYATLYYDNYLENPCYKDTVSPVLAWKSANVSYAFYLVNEKGEIIVNQTTGETGSFAKKIEVTKAVVYREIMLNNTDQVQAIEVQAISDDVLPKYYTLYDQAAVYEVGINSNSTGYWEISKGEGLVNSTYVTQYKTDDASAYSSELVDGKDADGNTVVTGHDYTHTVVWFAVVWNVQAHPDTVVIDYGLPVDISVLTNDMFGENGSLAGVGALQALPNNYEATHTAEMNTGFENSYTGTYGTAKLNGAKVRYTPANMEMDGYEKFAYAVNYTGSENAGYYYDTVTVIPATTIYYEDSFVKFDNLTWQQKENGKAWEGEWVVVENPATSIWEQEQEQEGTTVSDVTQAEDRPGQYSLTDANNIYGYDAAYNSCSTYSLGSAMKATVNYDEGAQASFTFTGTGFDVISMTDATTGTILVKVYKDGEIVQNRTVDTYYGYKHTNCHVEYTYLNIGTKDEPVYTWVMTDVMHESGECEICNTVQAQPTEANVGDKVIMAESAWIVDPAVEGAIWQVPVMKVEGLSYGRYEAVIQAVYDPSLDHSNEDGEYDFYLDAIRIYDPANDGAADGTEDTTIEDAYIADGEGWPSYIELRNKLINPDDIIITEDGTLGNDDTSTVIEGLVFIDGDAEVGDAQIADYISYGPNNEVYLAPGQRVAFILDAPENIKNVHIGIKSADGNAVTYTIENIAQATNSETKVNAGTRYNEKTGTITTATDMYYDLTGYKGDIIVISNTNTGNSGIISLTNIKSTYTSDPNATAPVSDVGDNEGIAPASLEDGVVGETEIYMTRAAANLTLRSLNNKIEETEPEESGTTDPDEKETEGTESTVPEESEPETTGPENVETQIQTVIKEVVNTVKNIITNLFSRWFR